jgi:hypothetical protein
MYQWIGNRIVQNPRMRVTAERDVEFCLPACAAEPWGSSTARPSP